MSKKWHYSEHKVSSELKDAVLDYYDYHKAKKVQGMRILDYYSSALDKWFDCVLVCFVDDQDDEMTSLCNYDGSEGRLRVPNKPNIIEDEYCYRGDEVAMLRSFTEF